MSSEEMQGMTGFATSARVDSLSEGAHGGALERGFVSVEVSTHIIVSHQDMSLVMRAEASSRGPRVRRTRQRLNGGRPSRVRRRNGRISGGAYQPIKSDGFGRWGGRRGSVERSRTCECGGAHNVCRYIRGDVGDKLLLRPARPAPLPSRMFSLYVAHISCPIRGGSS